MVDALFESIIALQHRLHGAGIATIVIGGVAIGAWGEPRLTRDVDLKIMLNDNYVIDWLRQFEQALDDSTLVAEYRQLRWGKLPSE